MISVKFGKFRRVLSVNGYFMPLMCARSQQEVGWLSQKKSLTNRLLTGSAGEVLFCTCSVGPKMQMPTEARKNYSPYAHCEQLSWEWMRHHLGMRYPFFVNTSMFAGDGCLHSYKSKVMRERERLWESTIQSKSGQWTASCRGRCQYSFQISPFGIDVGRFVVDPDVVFVLLSLIFCCLVAII